ncbi:hypothetical protein [Streptodolium elevatio]
MPFDDTDDDRNAWTDRELATALDAFLDEVVDVEAGLAAVLVQARHDEATDALDDITDVEAGLAAILAPGRAPAPGVDDTLAAARRYQRRVLESRPGQKRSDARRLRLRRDLAVVPLRRAFERCLVIRETLSAPDDFDVRAVDVAVLRSQAELLAADLERAIERDCAALDSARAAQASALGIADRLRDVPEFPPDRAYDVMLLVNRLVPRCLEVVNAAVVTYLQRHRWGTVLVAGRTLEAHTGDRLKSLGEADWFLNDFTAGDLTGISVHVEDLDGVRWSKTGTRWPPHLDTDDLVARSQETTAGSGIYIVLPGPAHIMA